MAISDAMVAQALLEYLQQHSEEFEEFLFERYHLDDGYVNFSADEENGRLLLRVTRVAQDGQKLSERDYAIRIGQ